MINCLILFRDSLVNERCSILYTGIYRNLIWHKCHSGILKFIPEWLMNGLANAGGMLPALGFALTLVVMGKKQYLPFSF